MPPFCGETQLDTLRQVLADEPVPPRRRRRDVPLAIEAIVVKCLEKNPERRYDTPAALADDLGRFLAGEPIIARPMSRWTKMRRGVKGHPVAITAVVLLTIATGIGLGVRWTFEKGMAAERTSAERLEREMKNGALKVRRSQYIADMRQMQRHVRDGQYPVYDLLARNRPKPGEEDVRGFAWYYFRPRRYATRQTLSGHHEDVYFVDFSPRGDLMATAGKDGLVVIRETTHWQMVRKIVAAQTEVNVATFSPDGKTIATVDDLGMLKLWDVATGELQQEKLAHAVAAVIVRFAPDGKTIITGGRLDGTVKIWDRTTLKMLDSFWVSKPHFENAIFSPDGSKLLTVGQSGTKLWKWPERTWIPDFPGSKNIWGAAFSHDGRLIATGDDDNNAFCLWDVKSGRLMRRFSGYSSMGDRIVFSADDRTVYSAIDQHLIQIWDVETGALRGGLHGYSRGAWALAASPDGRTIASASRDGLVELWDPLPQQAADYKLKLTPGAVPAQIQFSSDSKRLLVFEQSSGFAVTHWDVETGVKLRSTPLDPGAYTFSAAFAPDGRLLAVAGREAMITILDVGAGKTTKLYVPALGEVRSMIFSPDNQETLGSGPN